MNFIERLKHPHCCKYGAHNILLMATSCTIAIRESDLSDLHFCTAIWKDSNPNTVKHHATQATMIYFERAMMGTKGSLLIFYLFLPQVYTHAFESNKIPNISKLNTNSDGLKSMLHLNYLQFVSSLIWSYLHTYWNLSHVVNPDVIWQMIVVKELKGLVDRADPYTWAARDGSATCCSHHYTASA